MIIMWHDRGCIIFTMAIIINKYIKSTCCIPLICTMLYVKYISIKHSIRHWRVIQGNEKIFSLICWSAVRLVIRDKEEDTK